MRSGPSPACSSPGAYKSKRVSAQSADRPGAAKRAAIPAANKVAAASSLQLAEAAATSCRPAPSSPPRRADDRPARRRTAAPARAPRRRAPPPREALEAPRRLAGASKWAVQSYRSSTHVFPICSTLQFGASSGLRPSAVDHSVTRHLRRCNRADKSMPKITGLSPHLSGDQLAIYAIGAALILVILFKIPYVGRVFRALFLLRAPRLRDFFSSSSRLPSIPICHESRRASASTSRRLSATRSAFR